MIKANIAQEYPGHIKRCKYSDKTLYLADYTNQTKNERGVEVFENIPPNDIDSFELKNDVGLVNGYICFDNTSFTCLSGTASQCECVVFPKESTADSWIFFAELKYSDRPNNNNKNLRKAICQLYKTRKYYFDKKIFSKTNTCYLLASLPMQAEPFAQFIVTQTDLLRLQGKHNVTLRLQNRVEVQDDKTINVAV